ncbi:MAG: hypothetical protein IJP76_06355 [Paludibacteraceae bacterium]|nr:hypothetical protein [Paludibacteraceae bacterium]
MKKLLVILLALTALMSCKDQVEQLSGSYSYKISGTAVFGNDTVSISEEIGALELIRLSADSALLTFNALRGPVYATKAKVEGKTIELVPYERNISRLSRDYTVTATGQGDLYDGTMLVRLRYTGDDVKADSLTLLCKKN